MYVVGLRANTDITQENIMEKVIEVIKSLN